MSTATEVSRAEKCRVIAEKVMGWRWEQTPVPEETYECWTREWPESHNGRQEVCVEFDPFHDPAAMVEVMGKMGVDFIAVSGTDDPEDKYGCKFWQDNNRRMVYGPTPMYAVAEAAYLYALTK